ncbi:MAG: DALR domain-containing protein, partial [Dokdonella sp.]
APSDRSVPTELEAALLDDLNTPEAFAVMARLADAARAADGEEAKRSAKAALLGAGELIGLLQGDAEQWFKQARGGAAIDAVEIQRLVDERSAAKKTRNFAESDRLRDELLTLGVLVEDTPQGPRWKTVVADETGV